MRSTLKAITYAFHRTPLLYLRQQSSFSMAAVMAALFPSVGGGNTAQNKALAQLNGATEQNLMAAANLIDPEAPR